MEYIMDMIDVALVVLFLGPSLVALVWIVLAAIYAVVDLVQGQGD